MVKKVNDYAKEIHQILKEDHDTDVPVEQIRHILTIVSSRLFDALKAYRYINIYPFRFYFWLDAYKKYLKKKSFFS